MFTPNSICMLSRMTGRDRYGQESYGEPIPVGYAPVRMLAQTADTSVRADSSASRGQAEVTIGVFKILVEASVGTLQGNDRIDIAGTRYRVVNQHPRCRVTGELDHLEIDLELL